MGRRDEEDQGSWLPERVFEKPVFMEACDLPKHSCRPLCTGLWEGWHLYTPRRRHEKTGGTFLHSAGLFPLFCLGAEKAGGTEAMI